MSRVHLDTDFLVYALSRQGSERSRLLELAQSGVEIQMSAWAWFEFARGPRTAEQLAVARDFLSPGGVVELSEELSTRAAAAFRSLGSPRRRAADVAIGVTAAICGARLITRNARDFSDIPDLDVEGSLTDGSQ